MPMPKGRPYKPYRDPEVRFMEKVQAEPNTGCWLWVGSANARGYGMFAYRRRTRLAHRVSYRLFVDEVPHGLHVLHRCDTPACVNPGHLFLGTHLENIADRVAKGRSNGPRGTRAPRAKLTPEQVRAIRKSDAPHVDLARRYGVSDSSIIAIRQGKTWRHIA